jgi:hypothetical protein
MAERADNLVGRVEAVERRLDDLAVSVQVGFERVDQRFDDVAGSLVEQRQYTEYAYDQLVARMDAGFARLDGKIEKGLTRLDAIEGGFGRLERTMQGRFTGIERKLDLLASRIVPPEPPAGE